MSAALRIIFLGGIAEVGKNILVLETDNDIIVVDCGLGFPDEDQPGIDIVLPDIGYLRGRKEKIRGIFITHGHEDHIGALPWLWEEIPAPIYATKLTAGLISVKMRGKGLMDRVELNVFDPDSHPILSGGDFSVEPFRVTHSIPDAVGFGITTPAGLVVVTSDFKFDPTPIDNHLTDVALLQEFGDRGVRLLISDCVNVERDGRTPSERMVGETYKDVFEQAPGRIIIATFSSLISRIQQTIDTAAAFGRKVAPMGRSLENNVRISRELGYLSDADEVLINAKAAAHLPDTDVVYIVTGSQGEPMAVLSRIANRDHARLRVGEGDTVIVSSAPIPGNETSVYRIIDQLFHAGAEVVYAARTRVHVSGHASRDELREMIELTRPEYVIPTHGEHRHLALYADLAVKTGIPRSNVTLVERGDVVLLDDRGIGITEHLDVDSILVEGAAMGHIDDSVLRDRLVLSQDGLVSIAIGLDGKSGLIVSGPRIAYRGFSPPNSPELIESLGDVLRTAVNEYSGEGDARSMEVLIRDTAQRHIQSKARRRPMILPLILKV